MEGGDSSQKTILVIDDDITALDIVSYLFEEKGFVVQRYTNGNHAIEAAKTHKPDMVIVDLMMPEINGVDTIKELRSVGVDAPILAFTALDDPAVHEEAREAGSNEVITKPCRPDKLVRVMKSLLPDS